MSSKEELEEAWVKVSGILSSFTIGSQVRHVNESKLTPPNDNASSRVLVGTFEARCEL